uniref:phosphoglucomutase (alpha-D-glucose-1,6-bisphosphate-dependent) n=1 Tax=Chromera velia CCMP2878 TaxID=1169474 RepID=A0A0G4I532_9ALVE|mmetsp:Transcript_29169/g.57190  ORF Transcript_29169/g.57190 Transcript_29169/m.57190 type:complete len:577 (+) Transcript_29169:180-1910(+)|eukprot:Cvel_11076.t1-p1 / transcript=Cvel_11076.t1 / gene=Cvel_11076 / organism=Chromera_velia_CCMP2878 / gene_product=Phosphoglucomutase, cytoplasmic 1, putative / transcript_product=Phosphoglucomutase, cytoplasmic 1, putative / location=Cvel_scaffold684:49118-54692(-) / protein_length=576 / sequence_SO=supercontig / SO=protein_coding / is_pseudo=false
MATVEKIATAPIAGQKPGTSGLRKKTKIFMEGNYLANFVQSIFDSLPANELAGCTMLVSGDGRFYNKQAIQIISEIAAGNGVKRVWIGQNGLMSTPAASCVIREREGGAAYGGILLTASHNPGGPENDFGIKYNMSNGGPAPEAVTNKIFENTSKISEIKRVKLPPIDLSKIGKTEPVPGFFAEVISPTEDYVAMMKGLFDFEELKKLVSRSDFSMVYDGMHGVAGPYAKAVFSQELGVSEDKLMGCEPSEDFNKGHPDPNLTYAHDLVEILHPLEPSKVTDKTPDFGAAGDGDADRNMILGKGFFVTPSDSVAIIACYAQRTIKYFKDGLKGVSRSMPTSMALDKVAEKMGLQMYEVPTGWKFFGNLMDAGRLSICGEESFGTGSDHVREKDGIWAVLAWLSILAFRNKDTAAGSLVSIRQIVEEHWAEFGRNFYTRYDYEEVDSGAANKMMDRLKGLAGDIAGIPAACSSVSALLEKNPIVKADNFEYKDPVDGSVSSNQGMRFFLKDGSRVVWRLSGTGSSGATIRMYLEKYTQNSAELGMATADAMGEMVSLALAISDIPAITGRDKPTVIT